MDTLHALTALDALAQETRLAVFRTLIQASPAGIPAGEIAEKLNVRQNTMSSHLTVLAHAGMISKARHGRMIRYRANLNAMRELLLYLLEDCCNGDTQICAPIIEAIACRN